MRPNAFAIVQKPYLRLRFEQSVLFNQLTQFKREANAGVYVNPLAIEQQIDLYLVQMNILRERIGMPRKQHKPSEWLGFVNIRFNSETKEAFDNWGVSDEDVWHQLIGVIERGHKFTLTYNKQNGQINAAFTGGDGSGNNSGRTLSAFAKSWDIAVRALMFKHIEIAGGDWLSVGSVDGDEYG